MLEKSLIDDPLKAVHKITDYLARRDHSVKELKQKLKRRFTAQAIEKGLAWAQDQGWLKSPEELSELVTRRLLEQGKGRNYIQAYLKQKGLPSSVLSEDLELKACRDQLEKKYPHWREMDFKQRQKVMAFLGRRGFPPHLIFKVLSLDAN